MGGLQIIDVSNPAAPIRVGAYAATAVADLLVVGSLAFLADGATGLQIDMSFDTGRLYVADAEGGLRSPDGSASHRPPHESTGGRTGLGVPPLACA